MMLLAGKLVRRLESRYMLTLCMWGCVSWLSIGTSIVSGNGVACYD